MNKFIFATRPSKLARWQTNHVIELLAEKWNKISFEEFVITTKGDKIIDKPLPEIGGKGLFTLELEESLISNEVDGAVHSLKDLPTENPAGLTIGAIPERAPVNDVLICPRGFTIDKLPKSAVVGTSSLRRQAQLLAYRPDIQVKSIRGNVDTRIRKAVEGQYDAIILAAAGVLRLGFDEHITEHISHDLMLPEPGQGALGIQCRDSDDESKKVLASLEHDASRQAVVAERTFLAVLGGGCSIPVGAYAQIIDGIVHLQAVVAAPNGSKILKFSGSDVNAVSIGEKLAEEALSQGAMEIING
jgi:hydroxymethylbilane synthase